MTYSDVHHQIEGIIYKKMKVRHTNKSYTANFNDDFKMVDWEVNLLLYFVEDQFDIRLQKGAEKEISSMNQLVSMVYKEKERAFSIN